MLQDTGLLVSSQFSLFSFGGAVRGSENQPRVGKIEVSKPARKVEESGINFTVLLDEDFHVGGRFNSSEMPTTAPAREQGSDGW